MDPTDLLKAIIQGNGVEMLMLQSIRVLADDALLALQAGETDIYLAQTEQLIEATARLMALRLEADTVAPKAEAVKPGSHLRVVK